MAAKEKREGKPDAEQETVTVTSCVELANNAAEKVAELRDAIQTFAQTTHFRVALSTSPHLPIIVSI